jgi:3-oxoacyl-[acyl-carrier protein] reductase
MELGLAGKRAIICAASRGLGKACAAALAREGVDVLITGRDVATLEATAAEIGASWVPGDITTPQGRAAALAACPEPDILVTNAGGPPPGDFRDFDEFAWQAALNANMLAPMALIRAVIGPMVARRFGRIVNITSASVRSPGPALALSNGARTGLTAAVAALARDVAKHNVTINHLLPGPFHTDRQISLAAGAAKKTGLSVEEELARRAAENPAGRMGSPDEFGAACAFLCSAQAGFIVGQSLLLDGGAFNTVF